MKVVFYICGFQKEEKSKRQITVAKNHKVCLKKFEELTNKKYFRVCLMEFYSKTEHKLLRASENGVDVPMEKCIPIDV